MLLLLLDMTCQATGFVLAYSTRHALSLGEWAFNPAGRLLVLPMITELLLHKQAHLALDISILTYRILTQAGRQVAGLCQQSAWPPLAL